MKLPFSQVRKPLGTSYWGVIWWGKTLTYLYHTRHLNFQPHKDYKTCFINALQASRIVE